MALPQKSECSSCNLLRLEVHQSRELMQAMIVTFSQRFDTLEHKLNLLIANRPQQTLNASLNSKRIRIEQQKLHKIDSIARKPEENQQQRSDEKEALPGISCSPVHQFSAASSSSYHSNDSDLREGNFEAESAIVAFVKSEDECLEEFDVAGDSSNSPALTEERQSTSSAPGLISGLAECFSMNGELGALDNLHVPASYFMHSSPQTRQKILHMQLNSTAAIPNSRRPHPCPYCGKFLSRSSEWYRHIRMKHPDRPLQAPAGGRSKIPESRFAIPSVDPTEDQN